MDDDVRGDKLPYIIYDSVVTYTEQYENDACARHTATCPRVGNRRLPPLAISDRMRNKRHGMQFSSHNRRTAPGY